MSDGFHRIPCKLCQGLFIPRGEKNVFCSRACSLDWHQYKRRGKLNLKERLEFREQVERAIGAPIRPL